MPSAAGLRHAAACLAQVALLVPPPLTGGAATAQFMPANPAAGPAARQARACRDRFAQPFAPDSPWNMAIGDEAVYVPGNIFAPPKAAPIAFFNDHDYIITTTDADPPTPVFDQVSRPSQPGLACPGRYCSPRRRVEMT
jgi:hypothetical protein